MKVKFIILDFDKIKKNYFIYKNKLQNLEIYVNKRESQHKKINNVDLAKAASRVTTPKPFEPYVEAIERSTGKPFDRDLVFTVDEVRSQDKILIESFSKSNFNDSNINIDRLLRSAIQAFYDLNLYEQGSKLLAYSTESSLLAYPNNTSSGFPVFRRKDNDHARNDAAEWTNRFYLDPKVCEILSQPTAVFHRFQYKIKDLKSKVTKVVKKIRPVWGVSYRVLGFEGVLFRGLVERYDRKNLMSDSICTTVGRTKGQISNDIIRSIRGKKRRIVSVDYDKFDSTVPSFMWVLFYSIIKEMVDSDSITDDHLFCMLAFHNFTPYCWNSTELKYQRKGVPSGCLITSLFNTFVNRTIINYSYLESSNGKHFAEDNSYCLGDDLLFLENGLKFRHFLNIVKRFGLTINPEKCMLSDYDKEFSFIGYIWDRFNRPTEPEEWYIAHLCLPSRFYRNYPFPISVLQTYRGISICMSLYQGMEIFERLVGRYDFVWIDLIKRFRTGEDPIITYVGEDMRMYNLGIPLSTIFDEGWSAF